MVMSTTTGRQTNTMGDLYRGGNVGVTRDTYQPVQPNADYWDALNPGMSGQDQGRINRLANIGSSVAENTLGAAAAEGLGLSGIENRRHDETLGFLKGQFQRQLQPSLSEQTMREMYSQGTDEINKGYLRDFSSLRTHLGGAGITGGGLAAGLGAQLQLGRLGQITQGRNDIAIAKANADARDAIQQWQASLGLGSVMNESPSMIYLDTLGSLADIRLGQELGERQVEAAREGANATKDAAETAGMWGALGSLIGAL